MKTIPVFVCLFVSADDKITRAQVEKTLQHALAASIPDEDGFVEPDYAVFGPNPGMVVSGATVLPVPEDSLLRQDLLFLIKGEAEIGTADPIPSPFA